jgi:hypothetical protein
LWHNPSSSVILFSSSSVIFFYKMPRRPVSVDGNKRSLERDTECEYDSWSITQSALQSRKSLATRGFETRLRSTSPDLVPHSTSLLHNQKAQARDPNTYGGMKFSNDVPLFYRQNVFVKNPRKYHQRDPHNPSNPSIADSERTPKPRERSVPSDARSRREVLGSADASHSYLEDPRNQEMRQRFLREAAQQRLCNTSTPRTSSGPSEKELFFREKYLFLKERAVFLRERQSFMIEKEQFLLEKRELLRHREDNMPPAPTQTTETVNSMSSLA